MLLWLHVAIYAKSQKLAIHFVIMPPKKGKKGKKGKDKKDNSDANIKPDDGEPTDKETLLQQE